MKIGQTELFLVQIIIYSLVYLIDDYVGLLLCVILGSIALSLLILSLIFELIDRSKVPRSYYLFMLNAVIAALVVLVFFSAFISGSFDWTKE